VTQAVSRVVLVLMKSPEADATLDVLRADHPEVTIEDAGTYWQLQHPVEILVDLARVGEELGEEISLSEWLVVMSTFVGRVETEPDSFRVTSEMLQLEGA
jgi:hypothetical protein